MVGLLLFLTVPLTVLLLLLLSLSLVLLLPPPFVKCPFVLHRCVYFPRIYLRDGCRSGWGVVCCRG